MKCSQKIRLRGHSPLILETQRLNSLHDLWPFFTFILEGIKSVIFYEAFHKDLLSASCPLRSFIFLLMLIKDAKGDALVLLMVAH